MEQWAQPDFFHALFLPMPAFPSVFDCLVPRGCQKLNFELNIHGRNTLSRVEKWAKLWK